MTMPFKPPMDAPPPECDTFIFSEGVIITATGNRIELTPHQCAIIGRLTKRLTAGQYHAVSHADLASAMWGLADLWPKTWDDVLKQDLVDLRKLLKVGGAQLSIETHFGFGYRLVGTLAVEE